MHDRYAVAHDFLSPELGEEVLTISRLVNAFFRWEFNSCECLVRGEQVHPIDYANASPDVALTSLHYYFPWAMKTLLKWCTFCLVTGRRPRLDLDTRRYFEIGDREDLSYEEKLAAYRRLADEYFETDRYHDFCASRLAHVDELVLDWVDSADFDRLLVETVRATYPAHEQERFVAHLRGLSGNGCASRGNSAPELPRVSDDGAGSRGAASSAVVDEPDQRPEQPAGALRDSPGSASSRWVGSRRRAAARAARRRSGASGRRRRSAAPRRRSSRRRPRGALTTGAAGWRGRARRSSVTTFISVSLSSECAFRLAEPTVSQRSSTIPTLACTYRRSSRWPVSERIVVASNRPAPSSAATSTPSWPIVSSWPLLARAGSSDHEAELVARRPAQLVGEQAGRSPATTGTGSRGR